LKFSLSNDTLLLKPYVHMSVKRKSKEREREREREKRREGGR
jgi:hypothetical protein